MNDLPGIDQVVLGVARFNALRILADELVSDSAIRLEMGRDFERWIVKMTLDILKQDLDEISAHYPADWWQAFKERWFPALLLARWPVVYTWVMLSAWALYPKIALPDQHASIYLNKYVSSGPFEP